MTGLDWAQLGIQTLMILFGLVALYWKQRVDNEHRFTKLETLVAGLKEDHTNLDGKMENLHGRISGISKSVAEMKGKMSK